MIVKLQKPLVWPAEEQPTVLVYNRDRSIEIQIPYTEKWSAWFGSRLKRYAQTYYRNNELVIGRVVADQNW
jgi:hypothetical protein